MDTYLDNSLVLALVALACLALFTRVRSSRNTNTPTTLKDGAYNVPTLPYWIPLLGHLPNLAFQSTSFMHTLRSKYPGGIFALNLGGTTHNFVHSPHLTTVLMNQSSNNAGAETLHKTMLQRIFGFPANMLEQYDAAFDELVICYKPLLTEPGLGNMVAQTAQRLKGSISSLVTGSVSLVDQMPWECAAAAEVMETSGRGQLVEASLLPLIRDFSSHMATPSIFGADFLEDFPNAVEDLWTLDRGFLLLAAGLPRWVPIPSLTRAHLAKRKLLAAFEEFHVKLETNVSDERSEVGDVIKARMTVYQKHHWSIAARAATELSLFWGASANSYSLVYWMVHRIYADKALLEMLREETEPFVRVVKPIPELPIAEGLRIDDLNVDGLCGKCPLLKSCYIECLRLDAAPSTTKVVQQDFDLRSREKDTQAWSLRKGEYVHASHELHQTDPHYFEDPMAWKADRHVKRGSNGKQATAEMGSLRPYGESIPAQSAVFY